MDRHIVTAVLVSHDGARWLPETLKALLTQTRPAQRLVAVDTESRDRGPAILAEVVGTGNLITMPAGTGYGEAVAEALRHPGASIDVAATATSDRQLSGSGQGQDPVEWIWLLHDDSVPAHDALDRLLSAAESDPNIALLGPKLRDWNDRRLLLELGITIDGFGRRETGVERGELDQGQHDGRGMRDVLAVSSAGMLIRRDVWDRLGGFDTGLGLFRDDLDLGWRAHAEGHRVVAVSDAIVYHAEAVARGLREPAVAVAGPGVSASRLDRRNALFVLLVNLPFAAMLRVAVRNAIGSLVRALSMAIAKRPQAARDELAAVGEVLRDLRGLYRGRAARRHNRKRVYHTVRRFMARRVVLRRLGEWLAGVVSGDSIGAHRGRGDDEDQVPIPEDGPLRRLLGNPGVLLVGGLTVVSVIAERSLIATGGRLGGGALVPAWGGAADLWHQYLAGWHPAGLGSNAGSPPYIGVLAVLSTLLFGKPWLAVTVLLLGAVPLAGLTAYLAAHTVVPDTYSTLSDRRARSKRRIPASAMRVWMAAAYALLPVGAGAVAAGRLGTIVVLILLPLIGVQVTQMLGLPRSRIKPETRVLRARRAAWGAGLLLAVVMAFAPLTWLLALLIGALVWVGFGSRVRHSDLVIALGVPLVLLAPWACGLLLHPSRFLLEAGLHRPELVDARLPARDLLFLGPGGPGTPVWWVTGGLLAAAVLALPLRSRRSAVLAGWMLALFGLLAAILVSALRVTQGSDSARAWPSVALLFAAAGVLLAATAAVQRAAEMVAGKDLIYRAAGTLIAVAGVSAPLLAAGIWILNGVTGPVGRAGADLVPAFIGQTETGAFQPRTLVLDRDTGRSDPGPSRVSYAVLRGSAPMLGESETPTSTAAQRRMDSLVAGLAAGHGNGPSLARMGVQYVYVPHPTRDPLVGVLDAAPDLSRLGRGSGFALWRLVQPGGRLLLLDGQTVTPLSAGITGASVRIPAGGAGRVVLLTEPADGGWTATLNGSSLHSTITDGWAVGFAVPASGGSFELSHGMWWRHFWLVVQAIAVVLVGLLALPAGRAAEAEEIAAAVRTRRGRRGRGSRQVVMLRAKASEAGAAARSRTGSAARSGVAALGRSLRAAAAHRRQAAQEPGPDKQSLADADTGGGAAAEESGAADEPRSAGGAGGLPSGDSDLLVVGRAESGWLDQPRSSGSPDSRGSSRESGSKRSGELDEDEDEGMRP